MDSSQLNRLSSDTVLYGFSGKPNPTTFDQYPESDLPRTAYFDIPVQAAYLVVGVVYEEDVRKEKVFMLPLEELKPLIGEHSLVEEVLDNHLMFFLFLYSHPINMPEELCSVDEECPTLPNEQEVEVEWDFEGLYVMGADKYPMDETIEVKPVAYRWLVELEVR